MLAQRQTKLSVWKISYVSDQCRQFGEFGSEGVYIDNHVTFPPFFMFPPYEGNLGK